MTSPSTIDSGDEGSTTDSRLPPASSGLFSAQPPSVYPFIAFGCFETPESLPPYLSPSNIHSSETDPNLQTDSFPNLNLTHDIQTPNPNPPTTGQISYAQAHLPRDPHNLEGEITIRFSMHKSGNMYRGTLGQYKKSLVFPRCRIEDLVNLKHENVPKFEGRMQFNQEYHVVDQHILPIQEFYKNELESLKEATNGVVTRGTWWKHIEPKLRSQLRGVSKAWHYLHMKGFSCGGYLEESVYVDARENAVLMPRVPRISNIGDFQSLVALVLSIFNMATLEDSDDFIDDPSFPTDMYYIVKSSKYEGPEDWWFFNAPIFWDLQQTLNFILGADRLMKQSPIFKNKLKSVINGPVRGSPSPTSWFLKIKDDKELMAVHKKGADKGLYKDEASLLPFWRNCIMHMEKGKKDLKPLKEVMQIFSKKFPMMLPKIFYDICRIKKDASLGGVLNSRDKLGELVVEWTSPGGIFL